MVKNLSDFEQFQSTSDYLEILGDEWSDKKSLIGVLNDFIFPYINENSIVAEIGSGGGRITTKIADKVKEIVCFDISQKMLNLCKKNVEKYCPNTNTKYVLLEDPKLPDIYNEYFDFICIFDVFPHVDLHTQWKYFKNLATNLNDNGHALIHTSNLESPLGWNRFEKQTKYSVAGFYFVVPSMIRLMILKSGLQIVCESSPDMDPQNMYYNRDYIVIVKKNKKLFK